MSIVKICSQFVWLLALFPASVGSLSASDFGEGEGYTGVKAGVIGSGEVKIEGEGVDQDAGVTFGLLFDFPYGRRMHYGAAVEFLQMNWNAGSRSFRFSQSELLMDIGITMKAMFPCAGTRFVVRPGVGIGFGMLRRMGSFNGSNYLTLKVFSEFIYFFEDLPAFLIDGGVWYAPTGGDINSDITIGPLLFLRLGVLF